MDRIKVLIADDQRLFAHGIEIILRTYGKTGIAVAGIAENGSQAVRMAERLRPDVILMDVRMPVMDGTEATRRIHRAHPEIKILVLTTFDDDDYVFNALDAGAIGYVLKNVKPDQLVTAIRAVHAGDYFVSPAVGYKLVQRAREGAQAGRRDATQYHGELNFIQSKFERLTRREAEILHLLLRDLDNREIAERLYIAEQTVRNHVSVIYTKLGVSDRTHAKRTAKAALRAP